MAKELREIAEVETQIAKLSQKIATKRTKYAQHQANLANWIYVKNVAGLKTEIGQISKIDNE